MLRLALTALSSLQLGARIKAAIENSVKKAVIYAIAGVVLLFAAAFGLVAGYQALPAYGFSPVESAGIVAGGLVALALIVLAFIPIVARTPKSKQESLMEAPAESVAIIDKSLNKAMNQVGPLTLLIAAFAAGLLASRRR
jgi:hypothetical protein